MKCRLAAVFSALLLLCSASGVSAVDEPDRLWLVGENAAADGVWPVARRVLERFVQQFPSDPRLPQAVLLLGRARLATGDADGALEAFRRAQTFQPPPGRPLEAKFWEAEALFRLRRYADARAAYDAVLQADAASPLAPDALYGVAWSDFELGRPDAAARAFGEFVATWPEHPLVPSAMLYQARALVEQRRFAEATPVLERLLGRYPQHQAVADARYLLALARLNTGDYRGGADALKAFIAAYPQHPDVPAARRLLNETLARHGNREELAETYRALMAQSPTTPEALADAAAIAGRLGRPDDQQAAWRRLRAEFPEHPLARRAALEQANAAYRRQDWGEVVSHAQAAARSDEDAVRAEAWLLAGEAELKRKRFAAAEKAFEAAADVKSADPAVRYRALAGLGLAREEQKEWRGAASAYQVVAAESPDATLRDWAQERLRAVKSRLATPSGRTPKNPAGGSGSSSRPRPGSTP
ncbi:MAG TPA: tetratricopeptide repeat protein [Calidithermus sp.]|nr:tetratricopeptide repeat protein [Calidithermus sp.]